MLVESKSREKRRRKSFLAVEAMELKSQEMRKLAPELDPLRIGTGWKVEDLESRRS